jgi:hypothetical protein
MTLSGVRKLGKCYKCRSPLLWSVNHVKGERCYKFCCTECDVDHGITILAMAYTDEYVVGSHFQFFLNSLLDPKDIPVFRGSRILTQEEAQKEDREEAALNAEKKAKEERIHAERVAKREARAREDQRKRERERRESADQMRRDADRRHRERERIFLQEEERRLALERVSRQNRSLSRSLTSEENLTEELERLDGSFLPVSPERHRALREGKNQIRPKAVCKPRVKRTVPQDLFEDAL